MILKRLGIGFLRLLIGLGLTFSLVAGVTLTLLTLFSGSGDNLVLNRPGPDWGWGGGAAIAWALTVFWWLCWRLLPPIQPTQISVLLNKWAGRPLGPWTATIVSVLSFFLLLDAGAKLALHSIEANWIYFGAWVLVTIVNGSSAVSAWRQQRLKR